MATLRHDGKYKLLEKFTTHGVFQYSVGVVSSLSDVEFSTLLQKNYKIIEGQSVTISRDEAIAAARAILKHFEVE